MRMESTGAFYAHSVQGRATAEWQGLAEHLTAVAQLAGRFGSEFGGGDLATVAGLLHDLGKYTHEFQDRLRGSEKRVDHSTWGAHIALERYPNLGYLLAYAIAGHHAGLANGQGDGRRSSLQERMAADLPKLLPDWQSELDLPSALPMPPCK